MVTARFARACEITGLAFQKKHASDYLNSFLRRRPRAWGWDSRSCVQSLNQTEAQSRSKMLMAGSVRGFISLLLYTGDLQYDTSIQFSMLGRHRSFDPNRFA